MEVFISAVRFEKTMAVVGAACIEFRFIDLKSNSSPPFELTSKLVYPVNFASHMKFNKSASAQLSSEIDELGENLALEVILVKSENNEFIGNANLNLWVMIEDSCNIVRQVLAHYI